MVYQSSATNSHTKTYLSFIIRLQKILIRSCKSLFLHRNNQANLLIENCNGLDERYWKDYIKAWSDIVDIIRHDSDQNSQYILNDFKFVFKGIRGCHWILTKYNRNMRLQSDFTCIRFTELTNLDQFLRESVNLVKRMSSHGELTVFKCFCQNSLNIVFWYQ